MRRQCLLQGAVEHTRLHDRTTVTGADLDDTVHAGERQHDAARLWDGGAGGAGTGTTRDQRDAVCAAGTHQCLYLFDVGRQRYGRRPLVAP